MREIPREQEPNQEVEEIEKLLKEIPFAAGASITEVEFENNRKIITSGAKKMIAGKRLSQTELEFLTKEKRPEEVMFTSFEVMTKVFSRIGVDAKMIEEIKKHEGEHFDEAVKRGLNPKIVISFLKLENGTIQFRPSIKVGFKEGLDKTAEDIKRVAGAPEELSPGDEKMIN